MRSGFLMASSRRAAPVRREDLAILEERLIARIEGPIKFPGDGPGNKFAGLQAEVAALREHNAEQRGRELEEERQYARSLNRGNAARSWIAIGVSIVALIVAVLALLKK